MRTEILRQVRKGIRDLAALTVVAGIPVVPLWKQHPVIAALIGGAGLGVLVAVLVKRLLDSLKPPANDDPEDDVVDLRFWVEDHVPGEPTPFEVQHLIDPQATPIVQVNWPEFWAGCAGLTDWVRERVPPRGLYVGVNTTGTIIASYIAGSLADHDARIVCYRTPPGWKDEKELPRFEDFLPRKAGSGVVLLVDSQIKNGMAALALQKQLSELGFRDEQIWYICLVACGITRAKAEEVREEFRGKVPIERLFRPETNRFAANKGSALEFYPSCIAYIVDDRVRQPHVIR